MRLFLSCLLALLLCGCSIKHVQLYEGTTRPVSEIGIVSSVAFFPEGFKLHIQEIDGKPVNTTHAASFHLSPGRHFFRVHLSWMGDFGAAGVGSYRYAQAMLDAELDARAGHTYIPNFRETGDVLNVYFDDVGKDFPQECLPLHVFVNNSSVAKLVHGGPECQRGR